MYAKGCDIEESIHRIFAIIWSNWVQRPTFCYGAMVETSFFRSAMLALIAKTIYVNMIVGLHFLLVVLMFATHSNILKEPWKSYFT